MKRNYTAVRLGVIAIVAIAVVTFAAGRVLSEGTPYADSHVVMLDQGWTPQQAHDVYYTTQGSVLMPASWLRALRQPDGAPIMTPTNLQNLGFLDVHASKSVDNPYGWPVGFTVDRVAGVQTVGYTCAACHTAELRYRGAAMRIEGGSPTINLGAFVQQLRAAVLEAAKNPKRRAQFENAAVAYGYPKDRIAHDFDAAASRADMWLLYTAGLGGTSTFGGPGRVDALTGIANRVFSYDLDDPHNAIRGIAPTNFPYLWDIWRFDWVQYNGSVRQPMGRNIGEALGVGVRTNVLDAAGKLNPEPLRWTSSVRVRNLHKLELAFAELRPPAWPSSILGSVDPQQAALGRALFVQNCAKCHGVSKIAGTSPTEWAVHVVPYKRIGTDPSEVLMFAGAHFGGKAIGLGEKVPGALGIGYVTGQIESQAYKNAGVTEAERPVMDGWGRVGHVTAPCGYKARPLVGVWATPPYLHNGAVPSVFDLLSDTRPAHPILGNLEYDPQKLGTIQQQTTNTMVLDTSKLGNSNAGHWFTNEITRPGRIGPALTDAQKYDIIAYLKVATYADYPTKTVSKPYGLPCDKNFTWANDAVPDLTMGAR